MGRLLMASSVEEFLKKQANGGFSPQRAIQVSTNLLSNTGKHWAQSCLYCCMQPDRTSPYWSSQFVVTGSYTGFLNCFVS